MSLKRENFSAIEEPVSRENSEPEMSAEVPQNFRKFLDPVAKNMNEVSSDFMYKTRVRARELGADIGTERIDNEAPGIAGDTMTWDIPNSRCRLCWCPLAISRNDGWTFVWINSGGEEWYLPILYLQECLDAKEQEPIEVQKWIENAKEGGWAHGQKPQKDRPKKNQKVEGQHQQMPADLPQGFRVERVMESAEKAGEDIDSLVHKTRVRAIELGADIRTERIDKYYPGGEDILLTWDIPNPKCQLRLCWCPMGAAGNWHIVLKDYRGKEHRLPISDLEKCLDGHKEEEIRRNDDYLDAEYRRSQRSQEEYKERERFAWNEWSRWWSRDPRRNEGFRQKSSEGGFEQYREAENKSRQERHQDDNQRRHGQSRQESEYNNVDYYTVLGVSRNATRKEIESAYRKMAIKTHPDLNPKKDATEKFKKIQEAYDFLTKA